MLGKASGATNRVILGNSRFQFARAGQQFFLGYVFRRGNAPSRARAAHAIEEEG